jgi:hypothetical protein
MSAANALKEEPAEALVKIGWPVEFSVDVFVAAAVAGMGKLKLMDPDVSTTGVAVEISVPCVAEASIAAGDVVGIPCVKPAVVERSDKDEVAADKKESIFCPGFKPNTIPELQCDFLIVWAQKNHCGLLLRTTYSTSFVVLALGAML